MSKKLGFRKAIEIKVKKSQATAKKKAISIFTAMSVAHVDDEEPGPGEVRQVEKFLSKGDFYTGQWCDNLPHGNGKFLWTDGCIYIGEWFKGKTMGKGTFSWPEGATYEGEFKSGFMDGKGTYTSCSGEAYKGQWVMNSKHGQGTQSYANGDYYEGEWRRGFQEGHGRYQWKNGNHYIGKWRNGLMNGNGTMVWSNGNRYDGFWEDGFPKGNGNFRWADGSFYVGVWNKDGKEQNGTFYPSGSQSGNLDWDPQQVFLEDLKDCKVSTAEKVSILPSLKMPHWPGMNDEKLRKTSDMNDVSERDSTDWDEGVGNVQLEGSVTRGICPQIKMPTKRQGQTISKGHKNYELMLNLQLGIR